MNVVWETGRRIRAHRRHRKLSQQALAEQAGISYKYLGEVERGQVNLSVEVLVKIAHALSVPAGSLLDHHVTPDTELSDAHMLFAELPVAKRAFAVEMLHLLKRHD